MENQDLDLIGKTVGNMPYKIGIVDKDGNLKNQFVAKASTNRIDIPEQMLSGSGSTGGSTGGNTGGTTGGNTSTPVPQLPSTVNLFSGSAVGNILLSGPSATYDNVQDGLLITLSNQTLENSKLYNSYAANGQSFTGIRLDLSSVGLKVIKIPKEKLVVNSSIDISDQLSQCIGKTITYQYYTDSWHDGYSNFKIASFGGTAIKVLTNGIISMNLTVTLREDGQPNDDPDIFKIPVIQVNDYKN